MTRWRRAAEILDPCRDEDCELEDLHPIHASTPPTGDQERARRNRNRRRRHRYRIAKLKLAQAANNRRILLGR